MSEEDVTKREGPPLLEEAATRPAAPPDDPDRLAPGTLVGRYVVTAVLGEGGMGVVYSAFDPELDRKVAIKLLQIARGGSASSSPASPAEAIDRSRPRREASSAEQAWLLREAQALARLAHPNVIAVHDVGMLEGDRVFVAMELVEGQTLRRWLKAPRAWRDAVAALRAAGAGLAAAHAAGLVHRDFKPENVLVGKDDRVRVMDFGLARMRRDDDAEPRARDSDVSIDAKSPLSAELTIAGTVVGTPAYMAPELFADHAADARTDQFAFGVALYEALYRARPFTKAALESGSAAPPKFPARPKVPSRIQRVVARALALDAAQRYPSMDALLAELVVDPSARRRRVAIGAAIGTIAAGGIAFAIASRGGGAEPCTGFDAELAGVWDNAIKQRVRAAFERVNRPYAAIAYAGLERELDRYAGELVATKIDSCKATRVRGEQSEDVLELRRICLEQRLADLSATTQLLQHAAVSMVERGDKIAFALAPIKPCSNVAALRQPNRVPADKLDKARALFLQVSAARAQLYAGNAFGAVQESGKAVAIAKQIGWEPGLADALNVRGAALLTAGNFDEANATMSEAVWAAIRGRRDDVVAAGSLFAARVVADAKGRPAEARVWLGLANAAMARIGGDRALDSLRWEIEGLVDALAGDVNAAITAHAKALAIAEAELGKDHAALWEVEELLATTYTKAGAWAKATALYERSLHARLASVGPDHPDVAMLESNLGVCYRHQGALDKARTSLAHALDVRERLYGKSSPLLIATLDNYAELLGDAGELPAALATIERAQQIAAVVPGKSHVAYHTILTDRGAILVRASRFDEARALYDEALALETKSKSAALPLTQTARAELALAEQKPDDAAPWAERAIAGYEAAGGKDAPELVRPLVALARVRLADGKRDDARALLARAIAIGEKVGATELADARKLYVATDPNR